MGKINRFFLGLLLFLISALGAAQDGGGFGGGGFGGMGGGMMGGGMQGQGDPDARVDHTLVFPNRRPGTIPNGYEAPGFTSKQLILTPNDTVEWTLKDQKGKTVFLFVYSEIFDPAVQITDSTGKVLASNDDQVEGDQSAYVAYTFPSDEEYKVVVKNYRSTSGGRFTVLTKFIQAIDVGSETEKFKETQFRVGERSQYKNYQSYDQWIRLKVKKGEYYGLTFKRNGEKREPRQIIGPSGVFSKDYRSLNANQSTVFESLNSGEVYILYPSVPETEKAQVFFNRLEPKQIAANSIQKIRLTNGEMALLQHPISAGQDSVLKISLGPDSNYGVFITAPTDPKFSGYGEFSEQIRKYGSLEISRNRSGNVDELRRYVASGKLDYVVTSDSKKTEVTLDLSEQLERWDWSKPWTGSLKVGEILFRYVSIKRNVNTQFHIEADGFQPTTRFLWSDLSETGVNVDWRSTQLWSNVRKNKSDDRVILMLSSSGQGGSGDFKVTAKELLPTKIDLGEVVGSKKLEKEYNFTIDLEAEQQYRIVVNGSKESMPLWINDEDYNYIEVTWLRTETGATGYFKSGKPKKYYLSVFGPRKSMLFKIVKDETEKLIPPKGTS